MITVPHGGAPPRGGERARALTRPQERFLEAAVLALASVVFLVSVLPNLANHPAITDDEVWVMSAAAKIASRGVFGSDMFRGFFNADKVYFFNMPAHHFAVAAAFKLFGTGVLQARLVGVLYGLATIFLTYFLARRLYGLTAAVLAAVLLLFLRLNMGFDTGLPLQELAASARYDLAPVPFVLAGFFVILGGSSWRRATLGGALFGLATLFQFYGVFALVAAAAFFLLEPRTRTDTPAGSPPSVNGTNGLAASRRLRPRLKLIAALVVSAGLVCSPYAIFVLTHFHDFRGQAGTVGPRDQFASPRFYFDNFIHEPERFVRPLGFKEVPKGADPRLVEPRYLSLGEALRRRPSAKLALLAGLPIALVFTGWRAFRERRRPDRLLFFFLAGLALQFAFFEQLKLYVYWVLVVPFLCVGLAPALLRLLQPPRPSRLRWTVAAMTALCLFLSLAEGSAARVNGVRTSSQESDYVAIGRTLQGIVPPGARVVGSTSLWWALHETDYRSYFLLFYLTAPDAGEYGTSISGFFQEFKPDYLVLTRLGAEELQKHLSVPDRADYDRYLDKNATLVARLEGPEVRSYGYIEVWRLQSP